MSKEKMLLAYFVIYFFLAFVWRSWKIYKATGINPVILPNSDDAYGYVAKGFKIILFAIFFYLLALANFDSLKNASAVFLWLQFDAVMILAWIIMATGLVTTIKAQSDLSDSWRIGIDTRTKTNLITTGIYSKSRNPIFLSMRLAVFGAFLLIPNGIMLLLLGLSEVFMQIQVRLEEEHLLRDHGQLYEDYAHKVRRWI